MPEGDTLHRLALRLQPLVGAVVESGEGREQGRLEVAEGGRITGIEAIGKNLLIGLDNGWSFRVHLGIAGRCDFHARGERWRGAAARATLVFRTEAHEVVFFAAPRARILRTAHLRAIPSLVRLGPDLMVAEVDLEAIVRRARVPANARRPLGEVLLDQRIAAGIGNVYKCELLFLRRLDPWAPLSDLDASELWALYLLARDLMQRNLTTRRRITRFEPGPNTWVYGRTGAPCLVCRQVIRSARQGEQARTTYYCPSCQSVSSDRRG